MPVVIVFWAALAVLAYAWVGYPLILGLVARLVWRGPRASRRAGRMPMVTVVVAAFNEARVIRDKLRTSLDQRYPWDRLEVIVVSDGSSDGTDAIVENYPDSRVTLLRQWPRAGKSLALNRAVAVARGEILVFTDADATFAPDAIARLVAGFDDTSAGGAPVGLVSGVGLYAAKDRSDAPGVGNGYARLETFLRTREGALGFIASADGAVYALRRALYRDLAATEVNDLLHPIQASLAGHVSRFDARAFTVEPSSQGAGQEFTRHARIIAQGYHIVAAWLPRLLAARRWRDAWILVSHRPARWTTWLWLLTTLAASAVLAQRGGLYALAFAGQVAFYSVAGVGAVAERLGLSLGRLALPYYFCVVSAAGLVGLMRFVRGGTQAVWNPRGGAAAEGAPLPAEVGDAPAARKEGAAVRAKRIA
jgi:glycosyltransferase involved in cell wall biosynthesis